MTARGLSLLESVIGSESGHHVGVCGNEDPEGFPWNFRPGINEGDRFGTAVLPTLSGAL
jgi:hypothetical protein